MPLYLLMFETYWDCIQVSNLNAEHKIETKFQFCCWDFLSSFSFVSGFIPVFSIADHKVCSSSFERKKRVMVECYWLSLCKL